MLFYTFVQTHRVYITKVNPDVEAMDFQCYDMSVQVTDCNKCTTLVIHSADSGGLCMYVALGAGSGYIGNLYLPPNFSVNSKLL